MSLVEAIVGIAILSVAVIPILSIFANTSKYSAVAKVKQRATNTGMSVMESFKAYGIEAAHKKFEDGNFMPNATIDSFPSTLTGEYKLKNVKLSGGDSKDYNVVITVSEDQKIDYNSGTDEEKAETKKKYKETPYYNPTNDVVFSEDSAEYDPFLYIKKVIDTNATLNANKDSISDIKVTRTITFDINEAGEVDVKYTFTGTCDYTGHNDASMPDMVKSLDTRLIASGGLEKIFFYYYPAYDNRTGYKITDSFVFDNNYKAFDGSKKSVDLYVFKQKDGSRSNIEIKNAETSYKVTFGNSSASGPMVVYDVIDQNLGNLGTYGINLFDTSRLSVTGEEGKSKLIGNDSIIIIENGLTETVKNTVLMYKISVKVVDPKPIFNSQEIPAELFGTILK